MFSRVWRVFDRLTPSKSCDYGPCDSPATVEISDETGFCAEHASQFYEAAAESRVR